MFPSPPMPPSPSTHYASVLYQPIIYVHGQCIDAYVSVMGEPTCTQQAKDEAVFANMIFVLLVVHLLSAMPNN